RAAPGRDVDRPRGARNRRGRERARVRPGVLPDPLRREHDQRGERGVGRPVRLAGRPRDGIAATRDRGDGRRRALPGEAGARGVSRGSAGVRIGDAMTLVKRAALVLLSVIAAAAPLRSEPPPKDGHAVMAETDKRRRTASEYSEGLITVVEKGKS